MPKTQKLFIILCFLGLAITIAETAAFFAHTSICTTSGCKLTAGQTRYSDLSLLIPAIFVFGVLLWLGVIEAKLEQKAESWLIEPEPLSLSIKRETAGFLIDLIVSTALAGEGFLRGYLFFRLHHECLFCLAVFCLFVFLAVVRLIQGKERILIGFASFACVLMFMWLVKPEIANINLPHKKLILFYGKGCPHCEKVMEMCKRDGINVCPLNAEKYEALLRGFAIDEVPVLVVNNKTERKIIIGQANIEKYMNRLETKSGGTSLDKLEKMFGQPNGGACRIGEPCE